MNVNKNSIRSDKNPTRLHVNHVIGPTLLFLPACSVLPALFSTRNLSVIPSSKPILRTLK